MRKDSYALGAALRAAITLSLLCAAWGAVGQAQSNSRVIPSPPPATSGGGRPGPGDPTLLSLPSSAEPFHEDPGMYALRVNARRDEAKKRMSQNAARLLQLTAQLQADLQRGEATEADSKRLDEIAKLAHAVRDQMRQ